MQRVRYREIDDPVDEIISRFLSGVGRHPTEDDLNDAIDKKYAKINIEVLYLRRQRFSPQEIMKILHIGEMAYAKAVKELKER